MKRHNDGRTLNHWGRGDQSESAFLPSGGSYDYLLPKLLFVSDEQAKIFRKSITLVASES